MKLKIRLLLFLFSCTTTVQAQFNLFSLQDDIKLGLQLKAEIESNPAQYPILNRNEYAPAYQYLDFMTREILNSSKVQYRDVFAWEVFIIDDDETLNAFVTPGGYIYVYTGLIKYLDSADELAGVLGHEIAHADRRHSTRNLSKRYGLAIVTGVLIGGSTGAGGMLAEIVAGLAGDLAGLGFSRGTETEADNFSVEYLSESRFRCDGAAGFFEKIVQEGSSDEPPQFLSTHPSSKNRVENIKSKAAAKGCNQRQSNEDYEQFKAYF